jgi:hypothetical protein
MGGRRRNEYNANAGDPDAAPLSWVSNMQERYNRVAGEAPTGAPTFEDLLAQWAGGASRQGMLTANMPYLNTLNAQDGGIMGFINRLKMGSSVVPPSNGFAPVVQSPASVGGPQQGATLPEGTTAPTPLSPVLGRPDLSGVRRGYRNLPFGATPHPRGGY